MKLIDDIIELLAAEDSKLGPALMKTKILLYQLGEKTLLDWVNGELNGYPEGATLPQYRVLHLTLQGDISNGAWRQKNATLPVLHLDPEVREHLAKKHVTDSIAVIEDLAKDDTLAVMIAPEYYPLISEGLGNGYMANRVWGKWSAGAMKQVLTEVSSRLLDFLLELSERFPDELGSDEMRERAKDVRVTDLFNHAVFGDNVTIIVGDANQQQVNNRVVTNDLDSLRQYLRDNRVAETDIDELACAIEADRDTAEVAVGQMGRSVREWMVKMLAKANSAGWNVGMQTASAVLAMGIARFYGWG